MNKEDYELILNNIDFKEDFDKWIKISLKNRDESDNYLELANLPLIKKMLTPRYGVNNDLLFINYSEITDNYKYDKLIFSVDEISSITIWPKNIPNKNKEEKEWTN